MITADQNNIRLDKYLMETLNISRSKVQKMIDNNLVYVNGSNVKQSYKVKLNDEIEYQMYEENIDIVGEDIPLDIVYEDDYLVVVNKKNGMVVHPAPGNYHGTLVNALIYHFDKLSKGGSIRPGIVHRIDAYTTGLLMVAKDDYTHDFLAKQLQEKTTYRKYVALVWGVIKNDTGTIDAPIGRSEKDRKKMSVTATNSKDAITHFKVIKRFKDVTLIELQLETGRTHQIRVHMDYIGYPIVNDPVYGGKKPIDETGQCLHAKELGFMHPNGTYMKFDSELPDCFTNILKQFE